MRRYHMSICLDYMIHLCDSDLKKLFEGSAPEFSASEIRETLREKRDRGENMMCLSPPDRCPDYSPITGCPGHEVTDKEKRSKECCEEPNQDAQATWSTRVASNNQEDAQDTAKAFAELQKGD